MHATRGNTASVNSKVHVARHREDRAQRRGAGLHPGARRGEGGGRAYSVVCFCAQVGGVCRTGTSAFCARGTVLHEGENHKVFEYFGGENIFLK
jgi:hypothetical protein